nr:hypothetical protein CFP56_57543 [Quercus suber]
MNNKASAAHEPEVQVHPRQQLQPQQEGEPCVTLEETVELLRGQLATSIEEFQGYGGSKSTQVSTQGRPTTNNAQPFKIDSASLPSTSGIVNHSLKQQKTLHLSATSVKKLSTRPQIARNGELMLKARIKL